ncbi:Ribonuclease BN [Candidatus Rhodobacter oscarellae]|uniref:Ribonuclease BN n=1 Tax=Candidatus Rhodobacter oscarellae TaxID=1675527 RepID=A0A0J9H502_9RHOB|nr:YihY/virulence factor BrkB family protein [Candidatus Rhodobacter lobularis]KMW60653.1 Ribonuclease BN [Candidatus Rhodobacter lobularis]
MASQDLLSPRIYWDVFRRLSARNLDLVAAGVAFYAMLAVFPAIAAVVALWGFVSDPALVGGQIEALRPFMPEEAFTLVQGQALLFIDAGATTLGWATVISLATALWATRAGVGALVRGLNVIHGARPRPGFWHSLAAIALTLGLIAFTLTALVALIGVPLVLALLPLGPATAAALVVSRWALLVAVGLGGLWLVYRFGPNHRAARPRWVSPGAAVALALWAAAGWGFTTYIANFGSYNQIYGSIGAVVVLLMWFFISAYAVLLGAALNAEIGRRGGGGGG